MIYQIGWLSLTSVLSFFNRTCSTRYYVLCTMYYIYSTQVRWQTDFQESSFESSTWYVKMWFHCISEGPDEVTYLRYPNITASKASRMGIAWVSILECPSFIIARRFFLLLAVSFFVCEAALYLGMLA